MLQHPEKYLYIPYVRGGGLDSKILDLELTINAALSMKRIPILREENTSRIHRLDKVGEDHPINWDKYIDLSETIILKVDSSGAIKEIPDTLHYVYERDFDFNLYSEKQIRFIDETQIYDKENDQCPIVCLLKKEDLLSLKQPVNSLQQLQFRERIRINDPSFFILFTPSEEVNILTDTVLSALGTTRKDMKFLTNILYDFFPRGRFQNAEIYEKFYPYACMHVRYKGSIKRIIRDKISPELKVSIERVLRKEYKKKYKRIPLYIMSNLNMDYFDFLKDQFNIYRYTDFKELREQFSYRENIDHNLLYSVEKNIMRHAVIKIFPDKRNPFMLTGPWNNRKGGIIKSKASFTKNSIRKKSLLTDKD